MQMSVADREQEIMSAAGLSTVGGTGTVGHGAMERALRIVPGEHPLSPPHAPVVSCQVLGACERFCSPHQTVAQEVGCLCLHCEDCELEAVRRRA